MAEQITNYKCPACSGPLHFAGSSGMMECEYCGSKYTVEEIEQRYAEADANAVQAKNEADNKPAGEDEWEVSTEQWNSEGMKAYTCPSCSATLLCEDTLAASSCPYCGNPTIVPGQFAGVLKPDYVIPFKLEKDAAVDALKKHYGNRYLLPKLFKDNNHLEEIKGVYVPFWLYDGKSSGDCVYEGVKKEVKKTATEQITTSRFYRVVRKGKMSFEKIPADASTKMDDSLMESIEPYDYKDLKEFNKAYLTGYLADKYDVTAEENAPRAVARAKESTKNALRDDVKGYDTVTTKSTNIKVEQGKAYYAMMPVWLLNTNWNGKDYKFAMNGQTGKLVGDLPLDKGKLWGTIIVLFAALFALFKFAVGWKIGISLIVPAIIAGLTGLIMSGSMRSVQKKTTAGAYVAEGGIDITFRSDDFERQTIDKKPIQKAN